MVTLVPDVSARHVRMRFAPFALGAACSCCSAVQGGHHGPPQAPNRAGCGATRLTDACSKVENLSHAVALHFVHYNFCRVHQTTKTTPAMAAGVTDHIWSLREIAALLDEPVSKAN